MTLDARSRSIVVLLDHFDQMTAAHLGTLVFRDVSSNTPRDRALKRLLESRHITRTERRVVGGAHGGSGQYVYSLGPAGWAICKREGRYYKRTAINFHTLAIADAYVQLKQAEAAGTVRIIGVSTEPECHIEFEDTVLRPDLYAEVITTRGLEGWHIEADLGTERRGHLQQKMSRYWRYFKDGIEGNQTDRVLFLAHDEARARELRWIIERGPEEARSLFAVQTLASFPQV